jgi:hypothetical protein
MYLKSYILCLLLFFCCFELSAQHSEGYKNFYGVSWRGTAHENLVYARQMGYEYVFYQEGMEEDPLAAGLCFYIESPEYSIYERTISYNKAYTKEQISFYENYCFLNDSGQSFPYNIATGWFFNNNSFCAQLDYSNEKVRNWAINAILNYVDEIERKNPDFQFGGFAWDVPQPSGDFWNAPQSKGGRQVTASFFKAKTKADGFYEGHIAFYTKLFANVCAKYPHSRYIMEPYNIYNDWIKDVENRNDALQLMPDILCQEDKGTYFISNKNIYESGLITKDRVFCTSPSVFNHEENLKLAALASINGSFFSWYGRFGGTGDMPNYKSISEVPPRLKLIRILTNWEDRNKVALKDRKWINSVYSSPAARVTKNLIAIRKPGTETIFIVFVNANEKYTVPDGYKIKQVYNTDNFFCQARPATELNISTTTILPNDNVIGKGYICYLEKQ